MGEGLLLFLWLFPYVVSILEGEGRPRQQPFSFMIATGVACGTLFLLKGFGPLALLPFVLSYYVAFFLLDDEFNEFTWRTLKKLRNMRWI